MGDKRGHLRKDYIYCNMWLFVYIRNQLRPDSSLAAFLERREDEEDSGKDSEGKAH